MPQPSDSSYVAVTRHQRPFGATGVPAILLDDDNDEWLPQSSSSNADTSEESTPPSILLPDDDVPVGRHEAAVAPFMEEGELDTDVVVVAPTGNSSLAASHATERRRREEGWADLGLDRFTSTLRSTRTRRNNNDDPAHQTRG